VLIVAGFAGRRFPAVYKRASLVLMNTILLLMLLEFTSLMITRVFPFDFPDGADLRALKQREQIRETGLVFPSREFTPYLIWRSEGTSLPLMNVDSLGLRHTTYSCAAGDSIGSPRGCRRLHKLRGWGHGKTEQVSARGTRAGCAARS